MRCAVYLLLIALLSGTMILPKASAQAEEATEKARPKIGLALGGGGARGIAHVGVLRVLEELRIPVDYVAGTSMGAIVGSLFSLGLPPDEIERLILAINWKDVLSDHTDRKKRSFRRRQDDQANLLGVEFGFNDGGFVLPRSLVTGQNLAFALPLPALHTEGHRSFDDLPIPFRAVATDVETGEVVVLDHGNLFRAVRASMTVPGAFPPIAVEGRLLVDGGLVLNNPVRVVRDMGADIVIAVSLDEIPEARNRDQFDELREYIFQLLAIVLNAGVEESLSHADIVIRPDLGDILMPDFTRGPEAAVRGAVGARAMSAVLQTYALAPDLYALHRQGIDNLSEVELFVDEVRIHNNSRVSDAVISQRLGSKKAGEVNLQDLRRKLELVYDLGVFEAVDFDITTKHDSRIVTITTQEKSYSPNIFHLGVQGHATLRGDTQFSMLARLTRMEMNGWGGEWRNDFALGTLMLVDSEFYQPIGIKRRWFLSARALARRDVQFIYEESDRTADQSFSEVSGSIDVGAPLGRVGELRTGLRMGYVKSAVVTGQSPLESFDGGLGIWETRLSYDLQDAADFPHSGGSGYISLLVSREDLGALDHYEKFVATWTEFLSWKRATGFWSLALGSGFEAELPPQEEFPLGGFDSFAGYNRGQFRGSFLATGRLGGYIKLSDPIDFIGTQWYAGGWGDVGNVWPTQEVARLDDLRWGAAAFVGADTIVGPAFMTGSLASGAAWSVYVTLGLQVAVTP